MIHTLLKKSLKFQWNIGEVQWNHLFHWNFNEISVELQWSMKFQWNSTEISVIFFQILALNFTEISVKSLHSLYANMAINTLGYFPLIKSIFLLYFCHFLLILSHYFFTDLTFMKWAFMLFQVIDISLKFHWSFSVGYLVWQCCPDTVFHETYLVCQCC